MVSLVIVGKNNEMKQLVRDRAKKLRDADGLHNEALLSINRPRQHGSQRSADQISQNNGGGANSNGCGLPNRISSSSSSPKRFPSPSYVQPAPMSPDSRTWSRNSHIQHNILSGVPPKLKDHPRDCPSS